MFGKRVITGWHTCHKSNGLISTERVNWLNACSCWYAKIDIFINFTKFCSTEPIPSCISILKMIRRSIEKTLIGCTKIITKYISKALTVAKHNRSEICYDVMITEWLYGVISICLCDLCENWVSVRDRSQLFKRHMRRHRMCTDAWHYGIRLWCSYFEHNM